MESTVEGSDSVFVLPPLLDGDSLESRLHQPSAWDYVRDLLSNEGDPVVHGTLFLFTTEVDLLEPLISDLKLFCITNPEQVLLSWHVLLHQTSVVAP